jgi:RHS repeat-associated protein
MVSIASNSLGLANAYVYSDSLVLTNETISRLDEPGIPFEVARHVDTHQRLSLTGLTHNGTNITQVTYCYDAESRLSSMSCTNTQGRGFTLNYGYSGYNGTGFTLTTPTNAVIETSLIRDTYRRSQVTEVSTTFNSSEITAHSYAFDGLGRATNAVRSVQPLSLASTNVYAYNARSEVIGAGIETNDYAYFYDNIGNNLFTSLNAITNAYTVNNLNQYKAITNLLDLTGYRLGHDADGNTTLIDGHYLSYDPENRLSAYTFGLGYATGTLRSAYVYDYLGRRVKKLNQESMVKNPGGFIPLTYWHTNEMTTFVYDGWNLVHEVNALTNGTMHEVSYFWGKDLSGSMQGAGGVGGLLAASIDGDFYFPCYDNNGNITAYIDEGGSVIAYRQFDAFGNTIAKGGALVDTLHFWYSTKYLDHDTGFYYYGYRYYSPMLQRWINRDPIGEEGGENLYGFVGNRPIELLDCLGLKWKISRKGKSTAVATCDCNDTIETLAQKIHLDADEYLKWLQKSNGALPSSKSEKIKTKSSYLIPNEVHITQGNLDPNYGVFEVYSKTTNWKESVKKSYSRWWSFQRYKVIDHWTEATNGRSDGNAFSEITGALSGANIAIWLHFGHGGTRLINGTRYGGNLQVGSPPAQRGPANFESFKHHSLEMVTLYTCCAGIKGAEWAKALVAPRKYGAVLYASPETVSQGKWGPLKEAYYNE